MPLEARFENPPLYPTHYPTWRRKVCTSRRSFRTLKARFAGEIGGAKVQINVSNLNLAALTRQERTNLMIRIFEIDGSLPIAIARLLLKSANEVTPIPPPPEPLRPDEPLPPVAHARAVHTRGLFPVRGPFNVLPEPPPLMGFTPTASEVMKVEAKPIDNIGDGDRWKGRKFDLEIARPGSCVGRGRARS